MNSETQYQITDNSSLVTPSIPAYTHIIPHLPSPILNPTIADFERLIQHYGQNFFYLLEQQQNCPRSPT